MKEKKPNVSIDIKATVTDTETGETIAPRENSVNPFFRIPWGWICISFIALLILDVEYGKLILSLSVRDLIGEIAVWGILLSFIFFVLKIMDKENRDGGRGGCGYSCLGS